MSLRGRTAFVTGAGSGIGRSVCQILAREGVNIIAADINAASAQDTINLIDKPELRNMSLAVDVAKSSDVKDALIKILEVYKKPPSIIVNSAGIIRNNSLLTLSEESFQEVMDVNLKGTFLVIQTFANSIIEHKIATASIINIGSILGKTGDIDRPIYCSSKAGVHILTKTAAKDLGKHGIRVNAVIPGFIVTPMSSCVSGEARDMYRKLTALLRWGKPEEVAELIAFLASDKSSYVTGALIDVNGGLD